MSNLALTLPYQHRLAVAHLRPKYHKLEVLAFDPETQQTILRTQAREESQERETVLHEVNGEMYKKDADAAFTPGFPVFREKSKQTGPLHVKRAIRRRAPSPVKDVGVQLGNVVEYWMERRYLQREMEKLDYKFFREPTLGNAMELAELRQQLNTLDARLAIMSSAADILGDDE